MAYLLFGRAIASDMPLPELPEASGEAPAWRFERRPPSGAPPPDEAWFAVWQRPGGDPWLRACRTAGGYRLEYAHGAAFEIDVARRTIAGDLSEGSEETFRHLLVDHVGPLAMSLEVPVLHASSVAIDGNLVAFAGRGGAGKSTIAAALAGRGHALAADDALLVDPRGGHVTAVPAYPGVRLRDDSERAVAAGLAGARRPDPGGKRRFSIGLRFAHGPHVLTRIYLLDPGSTRATVFEPLAARDAMVALLRETYRLALDDRAALAREFAALTAVASRVACWRLSYPRRLDAARTLAEEIEAHARRTSDLGPRTSDVGPRTSDVGPRTSDLGPRPSEVL